MLVVVEGMTAITHQPNRFDGQMLPERTYELAYDTSSWQARNTGRSRSDWRDSWARRNCRVRIAINHLRFSAPLAFELGKALISHADIPEVVVAKALRACLLDRVPVEQIVGSQPVILPSPSREDMGDGLAPLQKKKPGYQPAVPCLDLFGQKQGQQSLWMQALPGQLKEAVRLGHGNEPAHGLQIQSIPCPQVADRLRLSDLHAQPGRLVDRPPDPRVQAQVVRPLWQCQLVCLEEGHTLHQPIKACRFDLEVELGAWYGAALFNGSLDESDPCLVVVGKRTSDGGVKQGGADVSSTPSSAIEKRENTAQLTRSVLASQVHRCIAVGLFQYA